MNSRGQSESGFTLIELLVVIAIIGLLASIILASLNTAQQKGRDARRVSDIQEIQNALELYDQSCGGYPYPTAPGAGLGTDDNNGCPSGVSLGNFISPVPADPSSGAPYLYAAFGNASYCSTYHLGAELETQTTGGSGIGANAELGLGSTMKCGPSQVGAYRGNGGYSASAYVAANSGDFSGGGAQGSWVYDVTP